MIRKIATIIIWIIIALCLLRMYLDIKFMIQTIKIIKKPIVIIEQQKNKIENKIQEKLDSLKRINF